MKSYFRHYAGPLAVRIPHRAVRYTPSWTRGPLINSRIHSILYILFIPSCQHQVIKCPSSAESSRHSSTFSLDRTAQELIQIAINKHKDKDRYKSNIIVTAPARSLPPLPLPPKVKIFLHFFFFLLSPSVSPPHLVLIYLSLFIWTAHTRS